MKISIAELKYLRSLGQKKVRDQKREFLLEGWRALQECLDAGVQPSLVAVVPERIGPDQQSLMTNLEETGCMVRTIAARELDSITDTVHAQGIVAVLPMVQREWTGTLPAAENVVVALDRVSDPGNLGTILRTCDWFGVGTVLLGTGCVSPYNEKVVRATVGSLLRLAVYEGVDLATAVGQLRKNGHQIIATTMDGRSLFDTRPPAGKAALFFGSEAHGLASDIISQSDIRITIPRFGAGESLNVSVAAAVVLAHWKQQ